ncbi:S9 family peptidase [Kineobactrum salinum]|uniref:Prolyl oligopeptidase family serine peptidase n=1 Tax=Kineobactrum salinum TaxID=2708301 RepID=A0A6C0U1D2_9GAMM|nr:DPP IV N-terminal domain-containing protein [Kineobactrum salinum]QIB64135.1 prolyl oligopeptidase family serine peptidase [Kineobactrum salinum]
MQIAVNRFLAAGALLAMLIVSGRPALAEEVVPVGKPLTLEAIFEHNEFQAALPRGLRWQPDGASFTYLPAPGEATAGKLLQHVAGTGKSGEVMSFDELPGLPAEFQITDVQWHAGSGFALLRGAVQVTWHGYEDAAYYVYDSAGDRLWPLAGAGLALRHVKLSPDGLRAGYVHDNNLFVSDLREGNNTAVTDDGGEAVFNGSFDYGSTMFGSSDAWRWSPDGTAIAFWRLDVADVKTYPLMDPLHSYPQIRRFHYPNVGEKHAVYRVGVYDVAAAATRWLDTGHKPDDYLPQMTWDRESRGVYVERLTRDHQALEVLYADAASGETRSVLVDRDPAWLDVTEDLSPLPGAAGEFLWTSERSGWRHIYRVGRGGETATLTSGDWSVDAIAGVDTDGGWAYFYAKKDSLIDQHVYRVALDGGPIERLTTQPGWHTWTMSPDAKRAIVQHSDARTPPTLALYEAGGARIADLVTDAVPALRDYTMSHTEFVTFTTDDGVELNGFFIKPPNFDPAKKYPVIGYDYGNAGSQVVVNRWGTQRGPQQDLWHRFMAQQGYVIFAMDNRTTTGRGKAAKNLTYGHYAKYAVLDQLQGAAYLKSLPWVDADRLGFWGWSGGGYLAAALMTKGAPHWKVAVSVAPVIDLARYQAVGVERWMGMPEDNPEGYAAVNLINYVDKLEGKLLLIHGTGDENVKFEFTLQFVDALIRANRQFDMLVYPNQRHAISDFRGHVFASMTRYFNDHL